MLAPGSTPTHRRGQTLAHTAPHPNAWKGFNSKVVFKKEEEAKASLAEWQHKHSSVKAHPALTTFQEVFVTL